MPDRAIKHIVKGGSIVFIGLILGAGIDFLIKIMIARVWGPAGYGLINLGLSVLMLAAVFCLFGLETGVPRFISFYVGNKEFEKVKGTIFAGMKIALVFGVILGFFIFLFSKQLSMFCFHPDLVNRHIERPIYETFFIKGTLRLQFEAISHSV